MCAHRHVSRAARLQYRRKSNKGLAQAPFPAEDKRLRGEVSRLHAEIANLHQEIATMHATAASARQEAAGRAAESAMAEAQLREANERLVVATVDAQTMTEAAEHATAQMSYMAEHDFLTGLPNRALLTERLALAVAFAERHRKRVALMFLDLDHFKHINDSLGHAVGDQLLQATAKRLTACVRHSDTVSRQGGDEFVVLLTEIDSAQDAAVMAEKLIATMAEPHLIGEHRLLVTLSIGISIYPDDGADVDTLLRHADTAMYHAKRSGRNNFQHFVPEMNARAVARQSIEEALRAALEHKEFVLNYQPKIELTSGAIIGAEALLRWQRPDRRCVGPTQFISIAEDCGLIHPIGRWVLGEACRQMQAWLKAGLNIGQIAVNVSAVEFHHKGFLAGIEAILSDTGLDPHYLELEMTESGLMQDIQPTTSILHALKKLGVHIAVDDFGTGYSSLSYLRRFPIDTLKIDQSFVQDIGGEGGDAIVNAIIAMGTGLHRRVIAEGVETQEQLAFLKSHHCTEVQGFFFSHPMAGAEFVASLAGIQRH